MLILPKGCQVKRGKRRKKGEEPGEVMWGNEAELEVGDQSVKIIFKEEYSSGREFSCDYGKKLFKRGWSLKGHVFVGHKRVALVPGCQVFIVFNKLLRGV